MNYSLIKQAMVLAGYSVTSQEDDWSAADQSTFKDFAHFKLGVDSQVAHYLINEPAVLEAKIYALYPQLKNGATEATDTEDTDAAEILAEQQRLANEQAEQQRLADEAKRLADEQAEQQRLADEQAEQQRLADEQKRLADEQKRLADEEAELNRMMAEEAEQKRLAAEQLANSEQQPAAE